MSASPLVGSTAGSLHRAGISSSVRWGAGPGRGPPRMAPQQPGSPPSARGSLPRHAAVALVDRGLGPLLQEHSLVSRHIGLSVFRLHSVLRHWHGCLVWLILVNSVLRCWSLGCPIPWLRGRAGGSVPLGCASTRSTPAASSCCLAPGGSGKRLLEQGVGNPAVD